jgi:hypothetical protein
LLGLVIQRDRVTYTAGEWDVVEFARGCALMVNIQGVLFDSGFVLLEHFINEKLWYWSGRFFRMDENSLQRICDAHSHHSVSSVFPSTPSSWPSLAEDWWNAFRSFA